MIEQLTTHELQVIRALREDEELTYEQIGARIGADQSTAHRILTKPDYQFSDLVLIRIRKALKRLPAAPVARPRRARAASA